MDTLWDRKKVDRMKRDAYYLGEQVVLSKDSSPADASQAAKELGFGHFSHLKVGYPVYSKTERTI